MLLDRYLERWDVRSRHETVVDAPALETFRAVRALDMGRSLPVTALFAVRAIPHLLTGKAQLRRSITLDSLLENGFVILAEETPRELVVGTVGQFWRPDSGIERIQPEEFEAFDRPGFAKAAINFTIEERGSSSLLATETRVLCSDAPARRKFFLYWRFIGPFSGLIRTLLLREVKRDAEQKGGPWPTITEADIQAEIERGRRSSR
jgi:hypothetical protein